MAIIDFIYDNISLSSIGYIICSIDGGGGTIEVENATRTFNNISMFNGKFMPFTSAIYENRIEFTFDIIKYSCNRNDDYIISNKEAQYLMRWLARPKAYKFKLVDSDYSDIYYKGSFNVTDIKIGDDRIGLRLNFISENPFGLHEPVMFSKEFETSDDELIITDISDDAGYIYPYIEIVCKESGNLYLTNSYDNQDTVINNCSEGEKIIITENLILATDQIDHRIQNDFNYNFLKISNNYTKRTNRITSNLKCTVLISYSPIAKVVY